MCISKAQKFQCYYCSTAVAECAQLDASGFPPFYIARLVKKLFWCVRAFAA